MQSVKRSGDGPARLRATRILGPGIALGLALVLALGASVALAAEIVEVRVGRHPEFTRVVFELDRPAGYRIERSQPAPGVSELVVSLEASSMAQRIRSSRTLIQHVEVEPSGRRTRARIRLAREGLKLKEMILSSPPRIVLDVLSDAPPTRVAAKPKAAAAKPKPAAKPRPAAKPEPVRTAAKPAPPKPAPKPAPVARQPAPAPTPVPAPERAPEVVAEAEPVDPEFERELRELEAAAAEIEADAADAELDELADEADEALDEAIAEAEAGLDGDDVEAMLADAAGEMAAGEMGDEPSTSTPIEPAPAEPAPRPFVTPTPEPEGLGLMYWALIGLAAIVLLAGGFWVAKRRGGESVDFDGEDAGDDASDVNPFAGTDADEQTILGGPDEQTVPPAGMDSGFGSGSEDSDEKESESVVFDGSEEETMEVISRDAADEALGGMPPAMGAMPEEFQRMMQEMQRRVEAMEGRIEELVDARDRLERQVAAQTEELRVQRAAIARTQRAVRNLARPEDGEEPEATEPALRDPNKPGTQS